MPFIRYQSPDDSSFLVFDVVRFRVDHGLFLLKLKPLKQSLADWLEEQRDWNLEAMKLFQENRRVAACLEWLESLDGDSGQVVIPDLKDEPAIDIVANRLIAERQYDRVYCIACEREYPADQIDIEPWSFEEDGVTVRGQRSLCTQGHTIHVQTDELDVAEIEFQD